MKTVDDYTKRDLRQLRAEICFSVINRGKLWYERLTSEQIGELNSFKA